MDIGALESSRGLQAVQPLQSPAATDRANQEAIRQSQQQAEDSVELSEEAESALQAQRERDQVVAQEATRTEQADLASEEATRQSEAVASNGGDINNLAGLLDSGQGSKGELIDTQA